MARPMNKWKTMHRARRELGAMLKLSPWIVAALLLVAVFWQADLAATPDLFQSPPTDTPVPPPTEIPAEVPTQPPEEMPTEEPTVELEPTAVVTPTATLEPEPTPTEEEPAPSPTPTEEPAAEEGLSRGRYAEGESNLRFEWGMLLDSLALGVGYLWLCCGVLVLMGVPLVFLALWVVARRRRGLPE